jgi:hypothetical protein
VNAHVAHVEALLSEHTDVRITVAE